MYWTSASSRSGPCSLSMIRINQSQNPLKMVALVVVVDLPRFSPSILSSSRISSFIEVPLLVVDGCTKAES